MDSFDFLNDRGDETAPWFVIDDSRRWRSVEARYVCAQQSEIKYESSETVVDENAYPMHLAVSMKRKLGRPIERHKYSGVLFGPATNYIFAFVDNSYGKT